MTLCTFCQRVNVHDLSSAVSDSHLYFSNPLDLAASAAMCELCRVIASRCSVRSRIPDSNSSDVESRKQVEYDWVPVVENLALNDRDFLIRINKDQKIKFDIRTCSTFPFSADSKASGISSFTVWFGNEYGAAYSGSRISLIAPLSLLDFLLRGIKLMLTPGSPAIVSGDIGRREDFPRLDCPDALSLMRMWTESCSLNHLNCAITFTGERIDDNASLLPTRVLDVGTKVGDQLIRLHESQNERNRFTALSHSWGPQDKRPILTTTSTRKKWIQGIPWNLIPKTFQDAILVTQAIGIRYIWIDSLCIIQDDHSDWSREAPKMGNIYQESVLTIVASYAGNSTEGLFCERKIPEYRQVKIPHVTKEGVQQSTITARIRDSEVPEDSRPEKEHLWSRAWITQEIVLSRRKIFFTKNSMIWSCRTITQTERGESDSTVTRSLHSNTGSLNNWSNLVKSYSARKLTYQTDRLVAIQGLVNEIQKKTGDEYFVGHWKQRLPLDLLWVVENQCNTIENGNVLKLPSWSWASTMCGVSFKFEKEPNLKAQCAVWQITETKLTIKNALLLSVVHFSRSWKSIQRKGSFSIPLTKRINESDLAESEESEDNESVYESVENADEGVGRFEEEYGEKNLEKGERIIEHTTTYFLLKSALPSQKLKVSLEVIFDVGKEEAERLAALDGGSEYQCLAIARRRLRYWNKIIILLLKRLPGSNSTYLRVGCGTITAKHNVFRRLQPCSIVLI